ncbi:MAG: TIGR00341 family protein [Chitinophagales bacterium]|nr:TIGR00341 family protein [Chitinophagales bacterium]
MKRLLVTIRSFFRDRFNLDEDKAEEQEIIESIRRNISFRGASLWILIFAIIIASVGLNVNSTAVIIGAMLISPLMGPIMGIGLGIGINDLAMVRHAIKNLIIAAFVSVLTSALYFWLSPLDVAQSELLARTNPSIWDVFIAFFGGLAGIVAGTRKEKTNVIPGVAIATALMPPLCTAGYGLATGNYYYFVGAFYLFFINSLFICIATFLIVRFLKFPMKAFEDDRRRKQVSRIIISLVIITVLPSIYLAYRIVDQAIFESNADRFVREEFNFARTQVVNKKFVWGGDFWKGKSDKIELLLLGDKLPKSTIDSIREQLSAYKLATASLKIYQGLDERKEIDFSAIKASIMQDVFSHNDSLLAETFPKENGDTLDRLKGELSVLYPQLQHFSLQQAIFYQMDSTAKDTLMLATFRFQKQPDATTKLQMQQWLKQRLQADSVMVVIL